MSHEILKKIPHVDYLYSLTFQPKYRCNVHPDVVNKLSDAIVAELDADENLQSEIKNINNNPHWRADTNYLPKIAKIVKEAIYKFNNPPHNQWGLSKPYVKLIGLYNTNYRYFKTYCDSNNHKDVKHLVDYLNFKRTCQKIKESIDKNTTYQYVKSEKILHNKVISEIVENIKKHALFFYCYNENNAEELFERITAVIKSFIETNPYVQALFNNCCEAEPVIDIALGDIDPDNKFTVSNYGKDNQWVDDITQANAIIARLKKRIDIFAELYEMKPFKRMTDMEKRNILIQEFSKHYGVSFNIEEDKTNA